MYIFATVSVFKSISVYCSQSLIFILVILLMIFILESKTLFFTNGIKKPSFFSVSFCAQDLSALPTEISTITILHRDVLSCSPRKTHLQHDGSKRGRYTSKTHSAVTVQRSQFLKWLHLLSHLCDSLYCTKLYSAKDQHYTNMMLFLKNDKNSTNNSILQYIF